MNNKTILYSICALIIGLSSCKKWLSIQPKTNVSETLLFEDEQGFKDALTGVYVQMANASLYGKEFTMATMDVMAQQYDVSLSTHGYYQTGKYNYEDAGVKARINQFWNKGYTAIANVNNLLSKIDAKKELFKTGDYAKIKGEAIGLRAFLHFDLFRTFGPMPSNGLAKESIPYVTKFEMKVRPNLSGNAFLDSCLKDVDTAIALLAKDKDVNYGTADPFFSNTRNHFNYWAALGLKARIELYCGNKAQAYTNAKLVIDSSAGRFPFITRNQLLSGAPDRTFLSEQLFGIYVSNLLDINKSIFKESASYNALTNKESFITQLFEGSSTDFRRVFLWKTDGTTAQRYPIKYWTEDIQTNLLNTKRVPLIRLSEMYFIAAEASDTLQNKIDLLNVVRSHRGISPLADSLTSQQVANEIFKAYRKEFYQEGQLFFYYKRTHTLNIDGYGEDMNEKQYVLPRPDDEIEFNPSENMEN